MRFSRQVLAACLLLCACSPAGVNQAPANLTGQAVSQPRAQSAHALSAQFSVKPALAPEQLTALTAQAQAYADETSRRRGIDFFRLHPNPVGIKLSQGSETSWLLSYLGTARERNDLNVELRVIGTATPGMNLNYSGPVTLSRVQTKAELKAGAKAATGFGYELVTGLPGQGVTEAYEAYADALGQYLRSRYQAQPFSFDDGPLVYAIHFNGQLQAFAFFNQANRLILGERKYADVQSVTVFSTQRKLLAAYTLIGFNPKTPGAETDPVWQTESDSRFGTLVQFGEL